MKYVKKPIVVEAFQFGYEIQPEWFRKVNGFYLPDAEGKNTYLTISTLEGGMRVYPGDMIIKGIKGEIYPCKKDIFDATYELFNEDYRVSGATNITRNGTGDYTVYYEDKK